MNKSEGRREKCEGDHRGASEVALAPAAPWGAER